MSRLLIYNQKSCLNAISFLFFPFTLHFSQSIAHLELQGLRKCLYFTNTSVSDPHRSLFVWTSLHSLPSILLRLFVRYDASRGERVRDGGSLSPRRIHDESSVLASGIPRLQTHRETSARYARTRFSSRAVGATNNSYAWCPCKFPTDVTEACNHPTMWTNWRLCVARRYSVTPPLND